MRQLQPVDEELKELEQMLDNKAPVVLKADDSFGVRNVSYKTAHGDSLCHDMRLVVSIYLLAFKIGLQRIFASVGYSLEIRYSDNNFSIRI